MSYINTLIGGDENKNSTYQTYSAAIIDAKLASTNQSVSNLDDRIDGIDGTIETVNETISKHTPAIQENTDAIAKIDTKVYWGNISDLLGGAI